MILLDTDHLSLLQVRDAPAAFALHARLEASPDAVVTTVITLEEQMRGRVMSFYTWEIGLALSVIPTFRLTPAISRLPARNWARRNG